MASGEDEPAATWTPSHSHLSSTDKGWGARCRRETSVCGTGPQLTDCADKDFQMVEVETVYDQTVKRAENQEIHYIALIALHIGGLWAYQGHALEQVHHRLRESPSS